MKWMVALWVLMGWTGLGMAQSVRVLCYHTFLGKPSIDTDFSIQEFDSHIRAFQAKGYQFVSFESMKAGQITGTRNLLLVIDDGNRTAYQAFLKVLKPRKIPVMMAIYPGIIGARSFAMTWDQLKDVLLNGGEVASHGYFHEFLSEEFKAKRPKDFDHEVRLSKTILESKLGRRIEVYVYPFGVFSVSGKQLLKETGYSYAMTIQPGPTLIPLRRNPNPLQLPRLMLTRSNMAGVLQTL